MKVVCVGDCGVDRYLPSGNLRAGGISANFTRQARRCFKDDDQIHIISSIADDGEASKIARAGVEIAGIECHFTQLSGDTPVQYIEIKPDGEKDFVKYEVGILKDFYLNSEQTKTLQSADLIMSTVYWQIYNVFDIVMAVPTTATIAVDFSDFASDANFDLLEKYIDQIDIAFFGLGKDQKHIIERISALAKTHGKVMVVTLGADGSIAFKGEEHYSCAAIKVPKIVDTTGAGDAFAAGFLAHYMHGVSLQAALEKGAQNAAKTIQYMGSVPI